MVPGCLPTRRLLRVMSIVCAELLFVLACTAQNPVSYSRGFAVSSDQAQYQATTYPVDGVVENSLTHEPIARVLVAGLQDRVLTDNEGRFELQLPKGTIMIRLQRPGYGSRGPYEEATHIVDVAPDMPALTYYLSPSASITAHVVLSNGDQPDGLIFTLYSRTVMNDHAQWTQSGSAAVDSGGAARFFSLAAPGEYVLCSNSSSDDNATANSRLPASGYPSLCFPGGTDFASATVSPLTLRPGQQADLEADLARQPFYPVTITPVGAGGTGVPFVQVHTQNGQTVGAAVVPSIRAWDWTFNLPNGTYYADTVIHAGKGPESFRYGRVDFTVAGGPVSGLKLAALPMQPISVEIHREFTATGNQGVASFNGPVSGGAGEPGPPLNLSFFAVDNLGDAGYSDGLRRDPNSPNSDLFQLRIMRPGRFWAHVDPYGPYYVSSITCGGVDLASHPLEAGPGGSSYPIEITLRNDMGRLTTMLALPSSDASAEGMESGDMARVFLYAIPLFPTVERINVWAAQTSSFHFSNPLPPGEYLVVASHHQQQFDLGDPKTIARLSDQGQKVTIEPGQTATVVLNKVMSDGAEAGR